MTKKILLSGRKRTSELTQNHAVDTKKEELLHLKSEVLQAASIALSEAKEVVAEALATAEAVAKVEAKVELPFVAAERLTPSKPITAPKPTPVREPTLEEDVASFVSQMQQLYATLEKAGSRHRHQYTIQARLDQILQEIKRAVQHRAWHNHSRGVNDATNMARCQEFVDQVRIRLKRVGIVLNSLRVHPAKVEWYKR